MKKTFDCSLINPIPTMEIEAKDEKEAKLLFVEAVRRAVCIEHIASTEIDVVD